MISNRLPEWIEKQDFNSLFNHKPEKRSSVLIYNKNTNKHEEKFIYRSYKCYLNVPDLDPSVEKSYMFLNKELEIPKEFNQYVEFAKEINPKYNQLVINWYNPEDYIELHSDCTAKMISPDSPILMINLNETDDIYSVRSFIMKNKETNEFSSTPLLNNHFYIIENNSTHRHYVPKGSEKRICLTFRMIKELDKPE